MKKQVLVALALSASLYTFGQKKEVKALQKAIKSENFTVAKNLLSQIEPLVANMDDKLKAKYYLSKAKALYANGKGTDANILEAVKAFDKAPASDEVNVIKQNIENSFIQKANAAYTAGDYLKASGLFKSLFDVNNKQGTYLYYAAVSALQGKDNDAALKYNLQLQDIKYTGVTTEYYAVNKISGAKELFSNDDLRKVSLRAGTHIKPTDELTESKVAEITKNIAFLYIEKGENDKALKAIKDARAKSPDDVNLIIAESNIYLQLKDLEKYRATVNEALAKNPHNDGLVYNLGVVAMNDGKIEDATNYFNKALAINKAHADSALNLSVIYINKGNALGNKMNALGTSRADFKKYDEYKAQKTALFTKGAKVLEDYNTNNPTKVNKDVYMQLKQIYNALGKSTKGIEAKLAQ